MSERLTIARIEGLRIPPGRFEIKLWDGAVTGLCLRCFASGGKTWAFRYRVLGDGRTAKVRTLKLGAYPAVSLEAARVAAKANAGLVAQGNDPAAVKAESRRRERSTLGILLEEGGAYQRSLEARGVVKQKVVMSVLRRGLMKFRHHDIARLTRRDFVEALDALAHLPGARHELRKHARGLLEWTTNSGLTLANPLAGLRLPPKTRQQRLNEASKRRALGDSDIAAVWKAADREGRFGGLVQLALLTAMRRGELAHLTWGDILDDRIVVPAERAKTGAAHEIPLTPLMRNVLELQTRTTSALVFPSDQTGAPMMDWSGRRARLIPAAGVGHFTIHDLRRSCRTLMDRLGVPEDIAERAIGHVRGGLVGIYALDQKWNERCDAFARVSAHIEQLLLLRDILPPTGSYHSRF